MAVAEGFEPSDGGYPSHAFEACSLGRSDTPPRSRLLAAGGPDEIARGGRTLRRMTAFAEAAASRYVSFTTFRRTGVPGSTPGWVAPDGDELLFISEDPAGKLKRLRNNPAVELRRCSIRGEVPDGAPTWRGTATVHRDRATIARARAATSRKYPEARVANAVLPLLQRVGLMRTPRAVVIVRLDG